MRFTPADSVVPRTPAIGCSVCAIEARYGGTLELTPKHPRPFAISFCRGSAPAVRLGGPLGARSTIKQHFQAYLRFFAYLREHSTAKAPADLRADDIDGYEDFLEAGGMTPIHRHTVLAKAIPRAACARSTRTSLGFCMRASAVA